MDARIKRNRPYLHEGVISLRMNLIFYDNYPHVLALSCKVSRATNVRLIIETAIIFFGKD
jgi:hypothetical protein